MTIPDMVEHVLCSRKGKVGCSPLIRVCYIHIVSDHPQASTRPGVTRYSAGIRHLQRNFPFSSVYLSPFAGSHTILRLLKIVVIVIDPRTGNPPPPAPQHQSASQRLHWGDVGRGCWRIERVSGRIPEQVDGRATGGDVDGLQHERGDEDRRGWLQQISGGRGTCGDRGYGGCT